MGPSWATVIYSLWTDNFKIKAAFCLDKRQRSSISHYWGQGDLRNYKLAERFLRVQRKEGLQTIAFSVNFPETPMLKYSLRVGHQVKQSWRKQDDWPEETGKDCPPHPSILKDRQRTCCSLSLLLFLCLSLSLSPFPHSPLKPACAYIFSVPVFSLSSL